MIVLDTNVLSEEMKPAPNALVHQWFLGQNASELFTTAVTEAEIRLGIAVLPDGKRNHDLQTAALRVIALFTGRILPFVDGLGRESLKFGLGDFCHGTWSVMHNLFVGPSCRRAALCYLGFKFERPRNGRVERGYKNIVGSLRRAEALPADCLFCIGSYPCSSSTIGRQTSTAVNSTANIWLSQWTIKSTGRSGIAPW
jgi:hypothetical protein